MKSEILFLSSCNPDENGNGLQKRCSMWIHLLEKKGYAIEFINYYSLSQNIKLLSFLKSVPLPVFVVNSIHFLFTFYKRKKLLSTYLKADKDIFLFRINTLLTFSKGEILYFFKLNNRLLTIDLDECEYQLLLSSDKHSVVDTLLRYKVFNLEKIIWQQPSVIKYISSSNELKKFENLFGASGNCFVESNKIFPKLNVLLEKSLNQPLQLLVLGDYNYLPNENMLYQLIDFLTNPVLNEDNVHFHIVGKGIKKSIRRSLSGHKCLTIHGFLSAEELKSLLLAVDFLFVPINLGGGTKLKIIEALSYGVPPFSTTKGVEGMNLVPMIHYIPFDKVEDFLALLSTSEAEYKQLRKSCFDVFNSQFALS